MTHLLFSSFSSALHFDAPYFWHSSFFNAPYSLEKRISLSEIHPRLQTPFLSLWPATLCIWSSSSPFTLEHSLSFVITLPLAVRLAPLLSSCHWQLRLSLLVASFSVLELDTVALLSGFKNLTVFSGFLGEWRTPYKGSTSSTKSKSVLNQLPYRYLLRQTIASVLVHSDIGSLSLRFGN